MSKIQADWIAAGAVLVSLAAIAQPVLTPAQQEAMKATQAATQEDHKRLMGMLRIESLSRGADGRNALAPNAANYDESKANAQGHAQGDVGGDEQD